jgi:hypothetical protein
LRSTNRFFLLFTPFVFFALVSSPSWAEDHFNNAGAPGWAAAEPNRNTFNRSGSDWGADTGSSSSGGYEYNTARRQQFDRGRAIPLSEGRSSGSSSSSSSGRSGGNDSDPNTFGTSAYYRSQAPSRWELSSPSRGSSSQPSDDQRISFYHNHRYYWITPSQDRRIKGILYLNSDDHDRQIAQIINLESYYRANPGYERQSRPGISSGAPSTQKPALAYRQPPDTIPLDVDWYSDGSYQGRLEYWRPIKATKVQIVVTCGKEAQRIALPLEPGQTRTKLFIRSGWVPN